MAILVPAYAVDSLSRDGMRSPYGEAPTGEKSVHFQMMPASPEDYTPGARPGHVYVPV